MKHRDFLFTLTGGVTGISVGLPVLLAEMPAEGIGIRIDKHSTFFRTNVFTFLMAVFTMVVLGEVETDSAVEQPCQGIIECTERPV